MTGIEYSESDEFRRDLKKLLRKFRSLVDDLDTVKKAVIELYHLIGIDNASVFRIPGYGTEAVQVYKIKKFASRSLKGRGNRSGIRVIYAFHSNDNRVEFLEIYYKGDKTDEDGRRIKEYLKEHAE